MVQFEFHLHIREFFLYHMKRFLILRVFDRNKLPNLLHLSFKVLKFIQILFCHIIILKSFGLELLELLLHPIIHCNLLGVLHPALDDVELSILELVHH